MNSPVLLFVAVSSIAPLQRETAPPDLLSLLKAGDEAQVLEQVRLRPDDAREAIAELLRHSAQLAPADARVQRLRQAEQLAGYYARIWLDSLYVHRVERFSRWTADQRAEYLEADSLRRAGIEVFYGEGPDAAIQLWERSLGRYRALGDSAGQAATLGNIASGYYMTAQFERALRYYHRALELAEAAADNRTTGNILGNIGNVHKDQGDLALAGTFYHRALVVRRLTGDRGGQAADLNNLGLVQEALGDLESAEAHYRSALQLNRRDGRERAAGMNLTNLANVATNRGDYDAALKLYNQALVTHRAVDDRLDEALDLQNLGRLHLRWGDYPAAARSLDAALVILEETGPPSRRAEVWSDLAAVHAARGEFQHALDALDRATAHAEEGDVELGPDLALQRADLLTELNDVDGAAAFYRQAKAGFEFLQYPAGEAEAESGLGFLHLLRGDYDLSEEAFARALLIQESFADPRPAAVSRILLGDVRREQGDTAGARNAYQRAHAALEELGDRVAEAATLGAIADLDRELGALEPAAAGYRRALTLLRDRSAPSVEWSLRLGLGSTLRAQHRLDDAAIELRRAIEVVAGVSGTLPVEEHRFGYLDDKWSTYAELAKTELDRGRARAAFEVSEQMRARQLVDLLARGRISLAGGDPALVWEEQTLRRRISQLAADLSVAPGAAVSLRGPGEGSSAADGATVALADAQSMYQRLLARLKRSHPEYASLVSGTTVNVSDVQRLLPAKAVFIEYLVSDEWTMAFVVSGANVRALELPIQRKALRQLIEFYRGTVRRPGSGDLASELWRAPLRRLYHLLIAPLEEAGYLDGSELLVIAPHAELHYVPFQALVKPGPTDDSFLIESFEVANVPSASVWARLSQREWTASPRSLLAMAPRPELLASSADEVRSIGRTVAVADVLVGEQATEGKFIELAPKRRMLHLATYGVLNTVNPLFSFVDLNADGETDGRLEVHEVFALELNADLVVLSACQTAVASGLRSDVPLGDDWVGLVRAFLSAGAQSVLASLWAVDDQTTARLMQTFYEELGDGRSKAGALARSQRKLLREPEYADPFYWAAFVLTGGVE